MTNRENVEPLVVCDTCGEGFHSYTKYNSHDCDRDQTPDPSDLFAVEEAKQREQEYRRGNKWLQNHGYL